MIQGFLKAMAVSARFRTVKEVKHALWRNQHKLGVMSGVLHARQADGGYRRLYDMYVKPAGPLSARYVSRHGFRWPIKEYFKDSGLSNWIQGGLDRKELLEWANEFLA